ncbi:ornithine decarboxylase-like, partial [Condylostylus longicornis]|uniref:ornithine decarboxylase-like n=1 Tax=Condylostylus longicornis TaxID=2530218 RepID=UPI00244E1EA7
MERPSFLSEGETPSRVGDVTEFVEDGNISQIESQWNYWEYLFPNIKICYPIRVNDDPAVLNLISMKGGNFDCTTKTEIDRVIKDLQLPSSRIILSNIIKSNSLMQYAASLEVSPMYFDNEGELLKIANYSPKAKVVLGIKTLQSERKAFECSDPPPLPSAFAVKYGAPKLKWSSLFKCAKSLKLDVVGIKVDVGAPWDNSDEYIDGLRNAYDAFQMGKECGFCMRLVDLGSFFPVDANPQSPHLVEAHKMEKMKKGNEIWSRQKLIISDGRFQSFGLTALGLRIPHPTVLMMTEELDENTDESPDPLFGAPEIGEINTIIPGTLMNVRNIVCREDQNELVDTLVFGNTCSWDDIIGAENSRMQLPLLSEGDWLVFPNMGSFTLTLGSTFNGLPLPEIVR